MTQRDPRWEKVRASIGAPDVPFDVIGDGGYLIREIVEFRITVWHEGMQFYQVQQIHKDDLRDGIADLSKEILNIMVERLDQQMTNAECATEFESLRRSGPKLSMAQVRRMDHLQAHLDRYEMYCTC